MSKPTTQFPRRYFLAALAALAMGGAFADQNDASVPAAPVPQRPYPKVLLKTNMGDIVLELYPDKAPKTVDNFLRYVKEGFYKGTIFHRVIEGFMIQGGGYDKQLRGRQTHPAIENEANNGLKNENYTIAMAREDYPHSATSQFFINVSDNYPLDYRSREDWGYCVFGKVVAGMDVVDKIKLVKTVSKSVFENLPVKPVIVESASITVPLTK